MTHLSSADDHGSGSAWVREDDLGPQHAERALREALQHHRYRHTHRQNEGEHRASMLRVVLESVVQYLLKHLQRTTRVQVCNLPRKNNFHGRWNKLNEKATECSDELYTIGQFCFLSVVFTCSFVCKVNGLPRKNNYHGRWEKLIQKATECLNRLFNVGQLCSPVPLMVCSVTSSHESEKLNKKATPKKRGSRQARPAIRAMLS